MMKIHKGEEEKDKNHSLKDRNKLISDALAHKEEGKEGFFTASYLSFPSPPAPAAMAPCTWPHILAFLPRTPL